MKQAFLIAAFILSGTVTSNAQAIAPPVIKLCKGTHFYRKQQVRIESDDTAAKIFYTTDGKTPTTESTEYSEDKPIYIDQSATIKAIAVKGDTKSEPSIVECYKDKRAIAIVAENGDMQYAMGKTKRNDTSQGYHLKGETYSKNIVTPTKFKQIGWFALPDGTIADAASEQYLSYNAKEQYITELSNYNNIKWEFTNENKIQSLSDDNRTLVLVFNSDKDYYFGAHTILSNHYAYPVDITKGTSRQNLQPNGYGTICMPYDIVVGDRIGATFYNILGKMQEGKKVTLYLEEETGTLEAGVPYIFHNDSENVYMYYLDEVTLSTANKNFTSRNGLIGNFNENTPITPGMYIIHDNKIKKCGTGCTINQGYAYINLEEVPNISQVPTTSKKIIKLTYDNTTAINNVTNENTNSCYYNIRGQQVTSPRKGLYIVNGKKVIIK